MTKRPQERVLAALSAGLGIVALLVATAFESILDNEARLARDTKNDKLAEDLEEARSRLLDGSAGSDVDGVLIGYTVGLVVLGSLSSFRNNTDYSRYAALISEVALLIIFVIWFVVSVNSCVYAQVHITCPNDSNILANNVLQDIK